MTRRICAYALKAQAMAVDLILNQCSSVGEAVNITRTMLSIPYLKADEPMAEEAVKKGRNISIIAPVVSTLGPITRLVENTAARLGKPVKVKGCLVDGAQDIFMKEGDCEKYNRMVMETIENEMKQRSPSCWRRGA